MKKAFLCSLFSLVAILLFVQSAPLEARHHCRSGRVQVGLGTNVQVNNGYVARRYVRPVATRPVIVAQDPYYAPVNVYAPVYAAPVYVEEVYVAPRCRPMTFGGLSFSLNLFR